VCRMICLHRFRFPCARFGAAPVAGTTKKATRHVLAAVL